MARRTARTIVLLLACVACTGTPQGVEAERDFDVDRYLGLWYEIARLDHPFERGLVDVTARYSLRGDGGIRVVNRGWDPEAGEWRAIEGRARLLGDPSVGELIRVEHGVAPEPTS